MGGEVGDSKGKTQRLNLTISIHLRPFILLSILAQLYLCDTSVTSAFTLFLSSIFLGKLLFDQFDRCCFVIDFVI